jgi:hypothetical protein
MQKKITSIGGVLLATMLTAGAAQAQEGMGIGIMVGEPTGVSFKNWLSNTRAIDAGAAWTFSDHSSFQLHGDYLIHDYTVLKPTDLRGRMPVYYGLGGRIKFNSGRDNDTRVGIRIPLGIAYYPAKSSIDLFGEIVPIMDLAPSTRADINVAIGARLYFK